MENKSIYDYLFFGTAEIFRINYNTNVGDILVFWNDW
jgi:hypothetical protein